MKTISAYGMVICIGLIIYILVTWNERPHYKELLPCDEPIILLINGQPIDEVNVDSLITNNIWVDYAFIINDTARMNMKIIDQMLKDY